MYVVYALQLVVYQQWQKNHKTVPYKNNLVFRNIYTSILKQATIQYTVYLSNLGMKCFQLVFNGMYQHVFIYYHIFIMHLHMYFV